MRQEFGGRLIELRQRMREVKREYEAALQMLRTSREEEAERIAALERLQGEELGKRVASLEKICQDIQAELDEFGGLDESDTGEDYDLETQVAYLVFLVEELNRRARWLNDVSGKVNARLDRLRREVEEMHPHPPKLPPHQHPGYRRRKR